MSRTLAELLHPWKDESDAPHGAETFVSLALGFLVLPITDSTGHAHDRYSVRVITECTQSPVAPDRKRPGFEREDVAWGEVPQAMTDLRTAVDAELADIEAKRKKPRARKPKATPP